MALFTSLLSTRPANSIALVALYLACAYHAENGDPQVACPWWKEFPVPQAEREAIASQLIPVANSLLKLSPPIPELATLTLEVPTRCFVIPCRRKSEFQVLSMINKGSFGSVYSAIDSASGQVQALKEIHGTQEAWGGFPYFMLREILFLKKIEHKHIIHGAAVAAEEMPEKYPNFFIVMEFVEWDLARLMKKHTTEVPNPGRFRLGEIKHLLIQLLTAVDYLHGMNILHRDLKPGNLLLTKEGVLKVADLGSTRDADRKSLTKTTDIMTMAYRPPELLLGCPSYTTAVDLWSVGCIFYELLTYTTLFAASDEESTLATIIEKKGPPPAGTLEPVDWDPGYIVTDRLVAQALNSATQVDFPRYLLAEQTGLTDAAIDLLSQMLHWTPESRITAKKALKHSFFTEEPLPEIPIPPPLE